MKDIEKDTPQDAPDGAPADAEARLIEAFREDHVTLGGGLHEIAVQLRGKNLDEARRLANQLDRQVGAHIAFEEEALYPALIEELGREALSGFHDDHRAGLGVVRALTRAEPLDEETLPALLRSTERMQDHVIDCAELFGAVGRLPASRKAELLARLMELRERGPRWTELPRG